MGTHPIFESDFDCLTDFKKTVMHTAEIEIDNEVCYISVTQFGDTNFVTISDTGTFGSFYQVEKKEKMGNEPIFQIQPIFGQAEDYLQVVCRYLCQNCTLQGPMMVSVILSREKVNKKNLELLKMEINSLAAC